MLKLLALVLLLGCPLAARAQPVTVDTAAGPVQERSVCGTTAAEIYNLRIYQVMVESFVDGDPAHDYDAGYGPSHHRGDLRGIIDSLDYIRGLGMNAIWLTPIFDSHAGEPQLRIDGSEHVVNGHPLTRCLECLRRTRVRAISAAVAELAVDPDLPIVRVRDGSGFACPQAPVALGGADALVRVEGEHRKAGLPLRVSLPDALIPEGEGEVGHI